MADRNSYKNYLAQTKATALTTSTQPLDTVTVPSYDSDIAAFQLTLTAACTGTISSGNGIFTAIQNFHLEASNGDTLIDGINGADLVMLTRMRNIGRTVTNTTIADAATASMYIPFNIEKDRQDVKCIITLNTLASMATSGLSACTITSELDFYYYTTTVATYTEKIIKLTESLAASDNTIGNNIPRGVLIDKILMQVTTESYYTKFKFSADGKRELENLKLSKLKGSDEALTVSGHVTGYFTLPVAPFVATSATDLTVTCSTADVLYLFFMCKI